MRGMSIIVILSILAGCSAPRGETTRGAIASVLPTFTVTSWQVLASDYSLQLVLDYAANVPPTLWIQDAAGERIGTEYVMSSTERRVRLDLPGSLANAATTQHLTVYAAYNSEVYANASITLRAADISADTEEIALEGDAGAITGFLINVTNRGDLPARITTASLDTPTGAVTAAVSATVLPGRTEPVFARVYRWIPPVGTSKATAELWSANGDTVRNSFGIAKSAGLSEIMTTWDGDGLSTLSFNLSSTGDWSIAADKVTWGLGSRRITTDLTPWRADGEEVAPGYTRQFSVARSYADEVLTPANLTDYELYVTVTDASGGTLSSMVAPLERPALSVPFITATFNCYQYLGTCDLGRVDYTATVTGAPIYPATAKIAIAGKTKADSFTYDYFHVGNNTKTLYAYLSGLQPGEHQLALQFLAQDGSVLLTTVREVRAE